MLSYIHKNATWASSLEDKRVLLIPNFLAKVERDLLFDSICKNKEAFSCRVNTGIPCPETQYFRVSSYKSNICLPWEEPKSDTQKKCSENLVSACAHYSNCVSQLAPKLFEILDIEPFEVSQFPLSITNGKNGHCAIPHCDSLGKNFKISLLYYMHSTPKVFKGGDLEIFESPTSTSQSPGFSEKPLSKIIHADNLLIAFPSHIFHGIIQVKTDSSLFEEGRIAFISFLENKQQYVQENV